MIYSTFGDVRGLLLGTSDNIATHLYVPIPSPMSCLQVLLLSRALEITVQRCLEAPFPDKYDLANLAGVIFAAHPSFAKHDTLDALFSAIIQLGKLMPTSNSKHSIDMRRRARIAVAGTMHVLKEQDLVDSPSSVQSFDSELPDRAATQAHQLEGLGRQISDPLESKSRCFACYREPACPLLCTRTAEVCQHKHVATVPLCLCNWTPAILIILLNMLHDPYASCLFPTVTPCRLLS